VAGKKRATRRAFPRSGWPEKTKLLLINQVLELRHEMAETVSGVHPYGLNIKHLQGVELPTENAITS
jgi:hypothetical protein